MIDWLSLVVPCSHSEEITGGRFLSINANGEREYEVCKRATVEGSFSTGLQIRTATHTPDRCTHFEISGNPVKFFQGHNLWGTDDLPGLVLSTMRCLANLLPALTPTYADRAAWESGDYRLTRVDVTSSFHLESLAQVLAWIRAAEQTAHLSHRGRGQLVKGSTLYFGKQSRRWSLKMYSKGQEITAKGHGQDAILQLPHARAWADRALRVELTLRSMELDRIGLSAGKDWIVHDGLPSEVTARLLRERFEGMTMTTTDRLDAGTLEGFRPALKMAYLTWEGGSDLRQVLPHRTFYKFRNELLPHGIDIAMLVPRGCVSNVVPLFKTLEAKPVSVPDWAIGTALYFEPARVA